METAPTSQPLLNTTSNGLVACPALPIPKNKSLVKAGADYVLIALEKALKLNILGADINTEFLELTMRVYAEGFLLSAKEYANWLSRRIVIDRKTITGLFASQTGYHALKKVAS